MWEESATDLTFRDLVAFRGEKKIGVAGGSHRCPLHVDRITVSIFNSSSRSGLVIR
jgi:hypothetical protein